MYPEENTMIEPGEAKKLADAVRRIGAAVKEFRTAGLKRQAIVVLLHDSTKVSKRDINAVLDGLETLEQVYLEAT